MPVTVDRRSFCSVQKLGVSIVCVWCSAMPASAQVQDLPYIPWRGNLGPNMVIGPLHYPPPPVPTAPPAGSVMTPNPCVSSHGCSNSGFYIPPSYSPHYVQPAYRWRR